MIRRLSLICMFIILSQVIDPADPNFAPVSTAFVKELAERAQGMYNNQFA